jgi:hypothetical protein
MTENTCDATNRNGDPCGLPAGWGTDHVGDGRCKLHGGASATGEDNGAFKHGLFSDHMSEEDRAVADALSDMSTEAKMRETADLLLVRLRRAVAYLNEEGNADRDFWDAFAELVEKTDDPEAGEIKELAGMLDVANSSMIHMIDTARKALKTLHDIEDDSPDRVEHSVDTDRMDEFAAAIGLSGEDTDE